MRWETSTIALPRPERIESMPNSRSLSYGDSEVVGSSKKTMSGSPASAFKISTS